MKKKKYREYYFVLAVDGALSAHCMLSSHVVHSLVPKAYYCRRSVRHYLLRAHDDHIT